MESNEVEIVRVREVNGSIIIGIPKPMVISLDLRKGDWAKLIIEDGKLNVEKIMVDEKTVTVTREERTSENTAPIR